MPTKDELEAGFRRYADFQDEQDQYTIGEILKKRGVGKKKRKEICAKFYDHNFSPGEIPPKLREEIEFTINNFLHVVGIPFTQIISHGVKRAFHERRRSTSTGESTSKGVTPQSMDDDDPTWLERGIGIGGYITEDDIKMLDSETQIEDRDPKLLSQSRSGSITCTCGGKMYLDFKRAEYACQKCGLTRDAPPIMDTRRVNPSEVTRVPQNGDKIRDKVVRELTPPYNEGLLRRVGSTIKMGVTLAFLITDPKVAYVVYMEREGWQEMFKHWRTVLMELQKTVSKDKRFYIPDVLRIDKHFFTLFDDTKLLRLKNLTGLEHVSLAGFANNLYLFTMRECLAMIEQIERKAIEKKETKYAHGYLGLAALYLNYYSLVNEIYRKPLNHAKLARLINPDIEKIAKSIKPPIGKPEFMELYGIGRKQKNSFYRRIQELEKFTGDKNNQWALYGTSGKFLAFGSPLDPYFYLESDRVARGDFSFFEPLGTLYRWKQQIKRCAMAQGKGAIKGPDVKSKGRRHRT